MHKHCLPRNRSAGCNQERHIMTRPFNRPEFRLPPRAHRMAAITKYCAHTLVPAITLFTTGMTTALAQAIPQTVYNCDLTTRQAPALHIQDGASAHGARILDPRLITLHNGLKAVTFSAQHTGAPFSATSFIRVRYTLSWSDDCGRPINNGANIADGFVLNPGQHYVAQSVAPSRDAATASLSITVDTPKNTQPPEPITP